MKVLDHVTKILMWNDSTICKHIVDVCSHQPFAIGYMSHGER